MTEPQESAPAIAEAGSLINQRTQSTTRRLSAFRPYLMLPFAVHVLCLGLFINRAGSLSCCS